jgi:hypothetical protein
MPKVIKTPLQITTISSRSDGSLRLSSVTPELSNPEKTAFLDLQNVELEALFQPSEYMNLEGMEVEKNLDTKSPSERLRNVLFALFKAKEEAGEKMGDFSDYYRSVLNRLIDSYKSKIDEVKGF